MAKKCPICDLAFEKGGPQEISTVIVQTEKGKRTLQKYSLLRNDGLHAIFSTQNPIEIHSSCRFKYILDKNVQSQSVLQEKEESITTGPSPPKIRRSNISPFNFHTQCFFCCESADCQIEKKLPHTRRRLIYEIKSNEIINDIKENLLQRNDEESNLLLVRLNGAIDYVSAKARYHKDCYQNYLKSQRTTQLTPGRPINSEKDHGFQLLCEFINENENSQFTLNDLQSKLNDFSYSETYSTKHLLQRLINHYGDTLMITEGGAGQNKIICFRTSCTKVLYEKRLSNIDTSSDKLKIIQQAAELISSDIRSESYDTDYYQALDPKNLENKIPSSLQFFLNTLIRGTQKCDDVQTKITAIAHTIIAATRPRTFLSNIHLSLAVWLHKKFGSRLVIDMLSKLGFCATYSEVQRFETSAVKFAPNIVSPEAFIQFVFDNADMNQATLTGHGTFHSMGGIKCVTPSAAVTKISSFPRLASSTKASEFLNEQRIPVLFYEKASNAGLRHIPVKKLDIFTESIGVIQFQNLNALYIATKLLSAQNTPAWSGYMQFLTSGNREFETTSVNYLPFLNLNPSNLSTLYSVLKFAEKETTRHGQHACIVTFDQPLYMKSMDIIAASQPVGELMTVVVRLGGFHTLMSFLGSIGYLMDGSGLSDLWSTVYASNSVKHMMNGHAISRALRAHFLTHDALILIAIESNASFTPDDVLMLKKVTSKLQRNEISVEEACKNSSLDKIYSLLTETINSAANKSRTSNLWKQYVELINIVKLFIAAERTGNWKLHLNCIRKMIPIFHATGHNNYAKSAHLYLQSMLEIDFKLTESEFQKFTESGYFTIRRNDKFWSGCWTDLIIEQCLMRAIKTSGGLSRGRGVTGSTLIKWIESTPASLVFSDALESLVKISPQTSDQHTNIICSSNLHDQTHFEIFKLWLKERSPWEPSTGELKSLASGVIATNTINCDTAKDIGEKILQKIMTSNVDFANLHLHRKERVLPISAIHSAIKINNSTVTVLPEQIFHRILISNLDEEELKTCFSYEMAPTATSLFDEHGNMREGQKSKLQIIIDTLQNENFTAFDQIDPTVHNVIDGGFLLHKNVWRQPATYDQILDSYVSYVLTHYGSQSTVVFDSYDDILSTKTMAQSRRYKTKLSKEIIFTTDMLTSTSQSDFFSSSKNKSLFIRYLTEKLSLAGINIIVSEENDADTLITTTAIMQSASKKVNLFGTDTDLLIILLATNPIGRKIRFVVQSCKHEKVFDIPKIQNKLGESRHGLLLLHAITGCDTTSALYRRGKVEPFKQYIKNIELQNLAAFFNKNNLKKGDIQVAGEKFILSLYGSSDNNIDEARYYMYHRITTRQKLSTKFELASLPPSSAACEQHSYRTYLQVQQWLGIKMDVTEWGWEKTGDVLSPIITTKPSAPMSILNMISCNCKMNCNSARCTCKRNGIPCSQMCGQCRGIGCANHAPSNDVDDGIHMEEI